MGYRIGQLKGVILNRSIIFISFVVVICLTRLSVLGQSPANDLFAQASILNGSSGQQDGSTVGATVEIGEPLIGPDRRTVWYQWTAPTNGMLRVSAVNWQTTMFSAIFRGATVNELTRSVQDFYAGDPYSYSKVTSGETVFIGVDTAGSPDGAAFTLHYVFNNAPANDSFASAEQLTGQLSGSVAEDTGGASIEEGEPFHAPIGSVWFKWTADVSCSVSFSIREIGEAPHPVASGDWPALDNMGIFIPQGGKLAPVYDIGPPSRPPSMQFESVAIYTGAALSDLAMVARGDWVTLPANAGQTYYICLENYDPEGGLSASSALYWKSFQAAPSNDALANALEVSEAAHAILTGNLYGATREPGEPDIGPEFRGVSAWFRYKAATFGTVTVGQSWLSYSDVCLAVFRGTNISNLSLVAKSVAGVVSFFARTGEDFSIAVIKNAGEDAYDTFDLRLVAPRYGVLTTTVADFFPGDQPRELYSLDGATAFLFENSTNGWQCVEIEPIINTRARFSVRPTNAIDGALMVMTVSDVMPAPTISFNVKNETVVPVVMGLTGQGCSISTSTDLLNWSEPVKMRLDAVETSIDPFSSSDKSRFYRIVRELP